MTAKNRIGSIHPPYDNGTVQFNAEKLLAQRWTWKYILLLKETQAIESHWSTLHQVCFEIRGGAKTSVWENKMAFSTWILLLFVGVVAVQSYPRNKFFEYGVENGDKALGIGDNEQMAIALQVPLTYYNEKHYYLYVSIKPIYILKKWNFIK